MPEAYTPEQANELLKQVKQASLENKQIVGHYKLRASGVKRLLGSIELDIIAKEPSYLYLSIDSFFKQPARIITFDGKKIHGLKGGSLEKIFELPLSPKELAELLLRRLEIKTSQLKKLSRLKNTLYITLENNTSLEVQVNLKTLTIASRKLYSASGDLIYAVYYPKYPNRFEFEATYQDKKHAMTLYSDDAKLNKGTFNEQLFRR